MSPGVADVLATVVSAGPRPRWPGALVVSCRDALGAGGVGLAVTDGSGPVAVAAATPGAGRIGEDLHFALGEGPGQLAAATGQLVASPDLATDPRWLHFADQALAAGIGSVFSVPLQVGPRCIGVLDVYCATTGPLPGDRVEDLMVHAAAATAVLLLATPAPHVDPVAGQDAALEELLQLADIRPVVHQAAGMVSVQLDVDTTHALARLRAHAFASQRPLREVAAEVVARQIRFDHTTAGVHHKPVPPTPPAPTEDP